MVDYTDQCGPALASVSASAARDDSIEVFTFYPTEQTWKAGDRNVTCIATTQTPVTSSLLR